MKDTLIMVEFITVLITHTVKIALKLRCINQANDHHRRPQHHQLTSLKKIISLSSSSLSFLLSSQQSSSSPPFLITRFNVDFRTPWNYFTKTAAQFSDTSVIFLL